MYKPHPAFEEPAPDQAIWRYLDFTKFVSLLDTKALYFTRADRFDDRFEGSTPRFNIQNYGPALKSADPALSDTAIQSLISQRTIWRQNARLWTFINCWHMNEHESAAMWSLYLKSNEGIAIRSTFARLRDSLRGSSEGVHIGKVRYIRYEYDWMPENNLLTPFLYKRVSFEHEREVRAIVLKTPISDNQFDPQLQDSRLGLSIPVDLSTLIEEVYVAPSAQIWFHDLVKSVAKQYQAPYVVRKSSLADDPVY